MLATKIKEQSTYDRRIDMSNYAHLVRAVNQLLGMEFSNEFAVLQTQSGIRVSLGEDDTASTRKAFSHEILTSTRVRIYAGTVRIHGRGNVRVPLNTALEYTEVVLSGEDPWVAVEYNRINATAQLIVINTQPVSDGGFLRVPLLSFKTTAGSYELQPICHDGDINIDTAA